MSKKSYVFAAVMALAGCAGQQAETKATETQQKQAEENVVPFDLYNCWPRKVEVPAPVNAAGLTAVWVVSQPEVSECLVDPASRGPANNTDVTVRFADTEQGPTVDVTGQNLTPQGAECIKAAVLRAGQIPPLQPGAKPVSTDLKIAHVLGQSPALRTGINEISDLAVPVRLAASKMCECFQPWKEAAPSSFLLNIDVKKAGAPAAKEGEKAPEGEQKAPAGAATVTVTPAPWIAPSTTAEAPAAQPAQAGAEAQPAGAAAPTATLDPTTQQVAACTAQKVQGLNLQPTSNEVRFQLPFHFTNTAANVTITHAPSTVRFFQLDGLRRQRAADAALAVAKRADMLTSYDQKVRDYNANKKTLRGAKLMETIKGLSSQCQKLVGADDDWKNASQAQLQVDQNTLDLAQQLAKADPKWNAAVTAAQKQIDGDQKEVAQITKQRASDERICPKAKY